MAADSPARLHRAPRTLSPHQQDALAVLARFESLSRSQLSVHLGLPPASAARIVRALLQRGLVTERVSTQRRHKAGRAERIVQLSTNGRSSLSKRSAKAHLI